MGWIVMTIIFIIIVAGVWAGAGLGLRALGRERFKDPDRYLPEIRWGRGLTAGLFGAIWLLATLLFSIHTVEAGHVGLVYEFGDIVGQRDAGVTAVWPWQTFRVADTRVQKIRAESDCYNGRFEECMEAFSAETQDVFVQGTINISVNPEDIQTLYRTVGPDYLEKIVRPRMLQRVKEQTVLHKNTEIAPSREQIRVAVRAELEDDLAQYSITVVDFLIENIDFRDEFKLAIEAKALAAQEAIRQQELVAAREAEARQKAATAQGEADRLRIEAEGQAAANRAISQSLTPELIQSRPCRGWPTTSTSPSSRPTAAC